MASVLMMLNVYKNQKTATENYFCKIQRRKTDITTRLFVANNCETFLLLGSKQQQISYRMTVNKSHQISTYNHRTNNEEDTR